MKRRWLLSAALWLFAGLAGAETAPLRVLIWADYLAPGAVEGFVAETGQRVIVDTYDSGDLAEALLLARGSGYDVAVLPSEFVSRLAAANALRPLDAAALPPLADLDPALMARLADLDPGHRHARPYLWGTLGIGYDAAALDVRLGAGARDSWSLLFDPATVARLAGCGVAIIDSVEEVVATVMLWQGRDPNARTAADEAAALAALAAIGPYVRAYTSSFIEPMALGEYCVVLGWSGDVLSAAAEARGPDLHYVVPREGGLLWADLFVVPVDAPQPAAAHRFIGYMLRPSVSAAAALYNLQPSPVRAAEPLIARSLDPAAAAGGPSPDDPRLVTLRSVAPARKAALLSAWTQLRVGPLLKVCGNDCSGPPRRR